MIRRENGRITTTVYRKPTHTQAYINWNSNHPKTMLLGVLKGLIHRAHYFCDKEDDLKKELELLRDVFIINGYPKQLVLKTIDKTWDREMKKSIARMLENSEVNDPMEEEKEFFNVLHTPYIKGFSEILTRDLKKLNVGWVLKKRSTVKQEVQSLKPSEDRFEQKDLIYKIDCRNCDCSYIGETGRTLNKRIEQHKNEVQNKSSTNGIYQHLKANKKHSIMWDKTVIVDKESRWMNRKLKEALFINAVNPKKDTKKLMNLEKGFDIHPIWNQFNSRIREDAKLKKNY